MRALGRRSRALLAGAAFAAFAGSFVSTPLTAHGAGEVALRPLAAAAPRTGPNGVTAVVPRRDPFAGSAGRRPAAAAPPFAPASVPAAPAIPAAIGVLPPNAGAPPAPFALDLPRARITAVITGAQPFAIVDDAGATRIVTLHDRIAGEKIVRITADGVRLEHGRLLAVETGPSSTSQEAENR